MGAHSQQSLGSTGLHGPRGARREHRSAEVLVWAKGSRGMALGDLQQESSVWGCAEGLPWQRSTVGWEPRLAMHRGFVLLLM